MRPATVGLVKRDGTPPWLYETLRRLIDGQQQSQRSLSAVSRGEAPDGSGNPLIDNGLFFFKPGLPGGQIAHGSTSAGGNLILSSTSHSTKGKIYFGTALTSAFDEANQYLGIGTGSPIARFHAHLNSTGTSGVNQLGTHFAEYSVTVSGSDKNILALAAYANNAASFDVAFISGGTNPVNGLGSIYFTDTNATAANGTGMRLAYGSYGGDTTRFTHLQFGGLDNVGASKQRNVLFLGFNDNCGAHFEVHFNTMWFESEGVTANNTIQLGINGDNPEDRVGVASGDRPVLNVASTASAPYDCALEVHSGITSPASEGTSAKTEILKLRSVSAANAGDRTFAVDRWGRLCLYNPGNGALTSRLSGRRGDLLVEDGTTGAGTPVEHFELVNTNAFGDGAAQGTYQMRLGFAQVSSLRWALIGANVVGGGNVQPTLLDRLGVRVSAFYISDGTYSTGGEVGAPLGMLNIFNFVANATILLALKRKSGQTGDFAALYDSDGTTKLARFDADANLYVPGLPNAVVDDDGDVVTADGEIVFSSIT